MTKKEILDLDGLWSQVVKKKANYRCEHCGRYDSRMEAAHVCGRRHRATRWGLMLGKSYDLCGHCLCHVCHQEYDEHGPLEPEIIDRTIKRVRKQIIQNEATRKVTKWQDYDEIKTLLEIERAACDDSPYSNV